MEAPSGHPPFDLAIHGARVYATAGARLAGDAVGIRDGSIVALGRWEDLAGGASRGTRVVNLRGATLLPAFIDAHTHFHRGAIARRHHLDFEMLAPARVGDILEHVRARAVTLGPGSWIEGDSLSPSRLAEGRPPDRHELDRVAPGHPVILRGIGKHVVAASSVALAAAGIDRNTPDPTGGRIERDQAGEPTGILHEAAKLRLDPSRSDTVVPSLSADERRAALESGYRDLHSLGIATIHEMVRSPEEADDHAALRAAGRLGVRVRLYYRVHESPLSLDWLERLGIRRGLGDDWLKVLGVKVSVDGFCIFRNAAVEEPYLDEPANRGLFRIDGETLDRLVARANRQGLQVAVHAVGPRAVDLALDSFERAGAPVAAPHRLEHAYVDMDERRLRRAHDLALAWSVQPAFLHAYRREWAGVFDPARIDRLMPLATGVAIGLPLVFDSDFPCAPLDPLDGIRLAVTRDIQGRAIMSDQVVSLESAWRAYTTTPADVAGDDRLGRIAVGALADLVVFDQDPFGDDLDLEQIVVRATMVHGRLVHGWEGLGDR